MSKLFLKSFLVLLSIFPLVHSSGNTKYGKATINYENNSINIDCGPEIVAICFTHDTPLYPGQEVVIRTPFGDFNTIFIAGGGETEQVHPTTGEIIEVGGNFVFEVKSGQ